MLLQVPIPFSKEKEAFIFPKQKPKQVEVQVKVTKEGHKVKECKQESKEVKEPIQVCWRGWLDGPGSCAGFGFVMDSKLDMKI